MGSKWQIRTNEINEFSLQTIDYTDYYINSWFEYIKLRIIKRDKIIFIKRTYCVGDRNMDK